MQYNILIAGNQLFFIQQITVYVYILDITKYLQIILPANYRLQKITHIDENYYKLQ